MTGMDIVVALHIGKCFAERVIDSRNSVGVSGFDHRSREKALDKGDKLGSSRVVIQPY